MGGQPGAAFWWPTCRRLLGAVPRGFGVHALEVPASSAVPCTPHYRGALPKDLHSFRSKSDPNDTAPLLDLLLRHRDRLRGLQPDTVETPCCISWLNAGKLWMKRRDSAMP